MSKAGNGDAQKCLSIYRVKYGEYSYLLISEGGKCALGIHLSCGSTILYSSMKYCINLNVLYIYLYVK